MLRKEQKVIWSVTLLTSCLLCNLHTEGWMSRWVLLEMREFAVTLAADQCIPPSNSCWVVKQPPRKVRNTGSWMQGLKTVDSLYCICSSSKFSFLLSSYGDEEIMHYRAITLLTLDQIMCFVHVSFSFLLPSLLFLFVICSVFLFFFLPFFLLCVFPAVYSSCISCVLLTFTLSVFPGCCFPFFSFLYCHVFFPVVFSLFLSFFMCAFFLLSSTFLKFISFSHFSFWCLSLYVLKL